MSKKFAVCFSGYPRFVRKQFDSIKKNILDGLGEYDIYAYFQWKDDYISESEKYSIIICEYNPDIHLSLIHI